jgi:hypothetical protein
LNLEAVLIPLDEQIGGSFISSWGHECGTAMCEKCAEIDKRIEHYERIVASINDQLTINRFKELVANLEAEKAALHPEQK